MGPRVPSCSYIPDPIQRLSISIGNPFVSIQFVPSGLDDSIEIVVPNAALRRRRVFPPLVDPYIPGCAVVVERGSGVGGGPPARGDKQIGRGICAVYCRSGTSHRRAAPRPPAPGRTQVV